MIRNLKLERYRGFDSYELTELSRVNLLVGKNNCGKTSILEAIDLFVSEGHPSVLEQCADRRGEMDLRENADSRYDLDRVPNVSHLFFGRVFKPGAGLRLSSDDGCRSLFIDVVDVDDATEDANHREVDDMLPLFEHDMRDALALVIKRDGQPMNPFLPVTEDGSILAMPRSRRTRLKSPTATPVVQLISADSLYPESMRSAWDEVLADGRESDVIDAMKILDDDLESIHFLTQSVFRRSSERAGILIGFRTGGKKAQKK
jgi:hypothetical protein